MKTLLLIISFLIVACHLSCQVEAAPVPSAAVIKFAEAGLARYRAQRDESGAFPTAADDVQVITNTADLPKLLALIKAVKGSTSDRYSGDRFVEIEASRAPQQIVIMGPRERDGQDGDDSQFADPAFLSDIQSVGINNHLIVENNQQGSVFPVYHRRRPHHRVYYDQQ